MGVWRALKIADAWQQTERFVTSATSTTKHRQTTHSDLCLLNYQCGLYECISSPSTVLNHHVELPSEMEEFSGKLLKYGFLHNHALLVRRLSTTSILAHVYSEGLVTSQEKARIESQYAEGSRTDILLDILHRQGVANSNVYLTFFNLLSDESITSGQNLEDVLKQIKKDAVSEEVRATFQYERRLLEENDHSTMLKYKATIVRTLSVDNILPELVSCGVVSSADKMKIM